MIASFVIALASPPAVEAAVYACDETGLIQAIADGGGPHTFSCGGPATIQFSTSGLLLEFNVPVILDGLDQLTIDGGILGTVLVVDGMRSSPPPPFTFTPADVELRNLELQNITLVQPALSSTLTLREVDYRFDGRWSRLQQECSSLLMEQPLFAIIDSTFSAPSGTNGGTNGFGVPVSLCNADVRGSTFTRFRRESPPGLGVLPRTIVWVEQYGLRFGPPVGSVVFENVTFADNEQANAVVYVRGGADASFIHTTFADNTSLEWPTDLALTAGALSYVLAGDPPVVVNDPLPPSSLVFANTIIAGGGCATGPEPSAQGEGAPLPSDFADSLGGNIEADTDSCLLVDGTDQAGIPESSIGLLPVGDYGGPTPTVALWPAYGTAAIDAGQPSECPPSDQRGEPRPEPGGANCDSGAVEYVPEPSDGSLLFAGALGLAALARRRA